ncbi:MAG: T9SS type A sorting domain-containing protein [Bacteroidales bacterium]|nr:T9SS type A sorting domain-containing protein [Bacteroidales bacterium]
MKYIGPPSLLDSADSDYHIRQGLYLNMPPSYYFEKVDEVNIYCGCPPTRLIPSGMIDTVWALYEERFRRPYITDSSRYFLMWEGIPEYPVTGWVFSRPICHDTIFCAQIEKIVDFNPEADPPFGEPEYTRCRFWKDTRSDFCVFPILDSMYLPDPDRPCLPRICPSVYDLTVRAYHRDAFFSWSGDTMHCGYELAYGLATEPYSEYTVIGTTDTVCQFNSMMPDAEYACRVRAMRCYPDGDTVWSRWSDTVHFHRPYYTVVARPNNINWGYVNGGGRYDPDVDVAIQAHPRGGNHRFVAWGDGDSSNPRTFTLVSDTVFVAVFVEDTVADTTEVGIEPVMERGGVVVRPNPFGDRLEVESKREMEMLELSDMKGRMVVRRECNATRATLTTAGLPEGVYLMRIRTTEGVTTRRVVKIGERQ